MCSNWHRFSIPLSNWKIDRFFPEKFKCFYSSLKISFYIAINILENTKVSFRSEMFEHNFPMHGVVIGFPAPNTSCFKESNFVFWLFICQKNTEKGIKTAFSFDCRHRNYVTQKPFGRLLAFEQAAQKEGWKKLFSFARGFSCGEKEAYMKLIFHFGSSCELWALIFQK